MYINKRLVTGEYEHSLVSALSTHTSTSRRKCQRNVWARAVCSFGVVCRPDVASFKLAWSALAQIFSLSTACSAMAIAPPQAGERPSVEGSYWTSLSYVCVSLRRTRATDAPIRWNTCVQRILAMSSSLSGKNYGNTPAAVARDIPLRLPQSYLRASHPRPSHASRYPSEMEGAAARTQSAWCYSPLQEEELGTPDHRA